ncbi:YicC/YloC family endoribonuclease [Enterococcus devriesei]|uniref:TIGR00255 family protein n=1 Tax=Enterococcus devriesei TaxID=319970 RepID=A0A1L8SSG7_9ENTE|nr:YicC/YloC family endoribonuclease [Enterococcus devriesei]MDU6523501.1 YicC/YloC family endoribonuclease [Enterococcus sp.]OJG34918.1 TIGR00255 family protein [Enterococcus devriesei]
MKSMTGYGQAARTNDNYELNIELKSVNNRFLDLQIRMPKELNPYEALIRQIAKEKIQRGRVDVFINLTPLKSGNKQVVVHWELLNQLVQELQRGGKEHFGVVDLPVEQVLVKAMEQDDYVTIVDQQTADDSLEGLVGEVAAAAFTQLATSREKEGAGIQKVLAEYSEKVQQLTGELASFVTEYEADYQQRYQAKLEEYLGSTVDHDRLLTELAILLERGDIHEELDRLGIHLEKMSGLLQTTDPVGRELDFLLQEMNREVNTIGSKSSPIQIKDIVVQLKTILEKIREQIQNVE